MSLFDGSPVMQVVQLANGRFAVHSTGGNTLSHNVADFETKAEAEEWMMRHTAFSGSGSGIMKPGDGEKVS